MKISEEEISTSRRNILKKATVVATFAVSSGIASNVQARTKNASDISDTKELSYLPSPKQAHATEGVLSALLNINE